MSTFNVSHAHANESWLDGNQARRRGGVTFPPNVTTAVTASSLAAADLEAILLDEHLVVVDVDTTWPIAAVETAKVAVREDKRRREREGMWDARANGYADGLQATLDAAVAAVLTAAGF